MPPSYLQSRVLGGLPLPRVALIPVGAGSDEIGDEIADGGIRPWNGGRSAEHGHAEGRVPRGLHEFAHAFVGPASKQEH